MECARVCRVIQGSNRPTGRGKRQFRGSGTKLAAEKLGLTVEAKMRFLCMRYVFLIFFKVKKYLWVLSTVDSLHSALNARRL